MEDAGAGASVTDTPRDVPTDPPATNGDAPISKTDVETVGKEGTTEIHAPVGDGITEAAVDVPAATTTSAIAGDEPGSTPANKEKKRKSISGVPEHKTKKLNKKKSTATLRLDCKPGDLYWARLKGYPPWPAVICDEEMLPETLLASRPVSAARPDGSLREDFQDGGKSAKDRTYPIMFLSTNEFAWLINTALTPLDPEECKTTAKLGKSLADAYRIASEKPDLEYFKTLLQQFQEESLAIEAAQRQREAEAEEKAAAKAKRDAERKARKSKGGDDDNDVEMGDGGTAKPTKKRKKDADSDADATAKSKKTPKITKLNAPKTPNGDSAKKSVPKAKKKVTAPKTAETADEQQVEMSDAERLAYREKHVLWLRHKLQKAFLSRETVPKEDEMPDLAGYIQQLEKFDDLEPDLIRKTKIHKVLKGIVKLDTVPRDDEFSFKRRSQNMLETWNRRMGADTDASSKPAVSVETAVPPTTNGQSAEDSKQGIDTEQEVNNDASNSDNANKELATDNDKTGASEQKIADSKPAEDSDKKTAEPAEKEAPTQHDQPKPQDVTSQVETAPQVDTKAATSVLVTESEPEAENAGEKAAAPDQFAAAQTSTTDADGDVKMNDNAAGTVAHD